MAATQRDMEIDEANYNGGADTWNEGTLDAYRRPYDEDALDHTPLDRVTGESFLARLSRLNKEASDAKQK